MIRFSLILVLLLSSLFSMSECTAGSTNVRTDEFSFIYPLFPNARSAGSAGALAVVQDDLYSFKTNPASAALLTRPELSGSLLHRAWRNTTSFYGSETLVDDSRSAMTSIGIGYPFPVYRGSFVIGGGFFARNLFTRDLLYAGIDEADDYEPRIQESILEDGKLGTYTLGFGTAVSPAVTVGASVHFWRGDFSEDYWQKNVPNSPVGGIDSLRIDHYLDANFDGMNMTIGACLSGRSGFRAGIALDTPFTLKRSGYFWADTTWYSADSLCITEMEYLTEAQFQIPFIIRFGLAIPIKQLTLATSFEFSDLSSMDWSGRSEDSFGDPRTGLYDELFIAAAGVEYAAKRIPLFLRSGCRWESSVFSPYDGGRGRFGYFFGTGVVLQSIVSLDLALGSMESDLTQSDARFSNKKWNYQLHLTTSIRF